MKGKGRAPGGIAGVSNDTLNLLLSIDADELQRLADMAKTLQGGRALPRTPQPVSGRWTGMVKSFNPERGFGFISSDEIHGMYGCDVFLHKNEYTSAGLYEGATVSFGIHQNPQGQPQASQVELEDDETRGTKRHREFTDEAPPKRARQQNMPKSKAIGRAIPRGQLPTKFAGYNLTTSTTPDGTTYVQKAAPVSMDGGPYVGVVKSYNEGKGYGFIQCEETFLKFRRDIFLHKNEAEKITEDKVGVSVLFSLQANAQGHPQAIDLTVDA